MLRQKVFRIELKGFKSYERTARQAERCIPGIPVIDQAYFEAIRAPGLWGHSSLELQNLLTGNAQRQRLYRIRAPSS